MLRFDAAGASTRCLSKLDIPYTDTAILKMSVALSLACFSLATGQLPHPRSSKHQTVAPHLHFSYGSQD